MQIFINENWDVVEATLNADATQTIYYLEDGFQSVITKNDVNYIVTRVSTTPDSNNVLTTKQGIASTSLKDAYDATIIN